MISIVRKKDLTEVSRDPNFKTNILEKDADKAA